MLLLPDTESVFTETRGTCALMTGLLGQCRFGVGAVMPQHTVRHIQPSIRGRGQMQELIDSLDVWKAWLRSSACIAGLYAVALQSRRSDVDVGRNRKRGSASSAFVGLGLGRSRANAANVLFHFCELQLRHDSCNALLCAREAASGRHGLLGYCRHVGMGC